MIKYVVLVAFVVISFVSSANISIVMKGRWTTVCNGKWISQHNRYDKALAVVINQNTDCDILPPQRFEIRLSEPEPTEPDEPTTEPPQTTSIAVSWGTPTRREDGTALETIDRFNIYYDFDGVLQDVIEVEAVSLMYTLADVQAGRYSFRVSAVSDGVEGKKSDAVTVQVIN